MILDPLLATLCSAIQVHTVGQYSAAVVLMAMVEFWYKFKLCTVAPKQGTVSLKNWDIMV